MANEVQAHPDRGFRHVLTSFGHWWQTDVSGTVDQADVIARRREECTLSARYLLMLAMSAGIAILGLLLSSPAVVIGAMLLSPLMGPIIGLGFSLATGDYAWMRQAMKALAIGTVLSILFTALIVFLSPLQTITSEIAARTRPNLFDLGVAFFSAIAGAYAMIRGREGTVVGVAIATALMPPLAVVGFGLATWNGAVFWGAVFLYVTNLLTIALTATIMARIYGFRTRLSEKQTMFQSIAIVAVFVALAVPLFISLRTIVWETRSTQKIRSEISDVFESKSVVSDVAMNWDSDPIQISATVFTPRLESEAESRAARAIAREIGRPVELTIVQSRVGPGQDAAEEAQLAAARANEAAAVERAQDLGERLALVAGVPESDVLIDRERRRALVRAVPLPGATLAAYRELEQRIAALEPEWTIELVPPVRPLPAIAFERMEPGEGDEEAPQFGPSDAGRQAIQLADWAQRRVNVPVTLTGPAAAVEDVRSYLATRGASVTTRPSGTGYGTVQLDWTDPDEIAGE